MAKRPAPEEPTPPVVPSHASMSTRILAARVHAVVVHANNKSVEKASARLLALMCFLQGGLLRSKTKTTPLVDTLGVVVASFVDAASASNDERTFAFLDELCAFESRVDALIHELATEASELREKALAENEAQRKIVVLKGKYARKVDNVADVAQQCAEGILPSFASEPDNVIRAQALTLLAYADLAKAVLPKACDAARAATNPAKRQALMNHAHASVVSLRDASLHFKQADPDDPLEPFSLVHMSRAANGLKALMELTKPSAGAGAGGAGAK